MSPIYLVSYETINVTGILTTLKLRFQLACGKQDVVMFCVNISAKYSNTFFVQSSEIVKDDDSFEPAEVFVAFPNIRMGMDYFVHAHLNANGTLIGPEHKRIINIPLNICKWFVFICTHADIYNSVISGDKLHWLSIQGIYDFLIIVIY